MFAPADPRRYNDDPLINMMGALGDPMGGMAKRVFPATLFEYCFIKAMTGISSDPNPGAEGNPG